MTFPLATTYAARAHLEGNTNLKSALVRTEASTQHQSGTHMHIYIYIYIYICVYTLVRLGKPRALRTYIYIYISPSQDSRKLNATTTGRTKC